MMPEYNCVETIPDSAGGFSLRLTSLGGRAIQRLHMGVIHKGPTVRVFIGRISWTIFTMSGFSHSTE
jgi:hypothetical protein